MIKSIRAGLCAIPFILSPFSLWAGDPGTRGAAFLRVGAGPRAAAMGDAQSAIVDDAYASYWNPAGLTAVRRAELALVYQRAFEDVQEQNLNFAFPVRRAMSMGLYATRMSVDSFSSFDAGGNSRGDVDSSEGAYGLALGFAKRSLSVGVGAKLIHSSLGPVDATSHAFDVGALWKLPLSARKGFKRSLSFALSSQNFGPALVYDEEKTKLPRTNRIGAGYESFLFGRRWVSALDYSFSPDQRGFYSVGQEFWMNRVLALRVGFRSRQDEGSGIRAGMAIGLRSVQLAYSISPFGFLGESHRFGLSYKFGSGKPVVASKPLPPTPAVTKPVMPTSPPPEKPKDPVTLSLPVSSSPLDGVVPPVVPPVKPLNLGTSVPAKKKPEKPVEPLYKTKKRILQGDAKSLVEKGKQHLMKEQYHEATVAFGQALRVEPNNKNALELMRKALNEMERKKRREKGIYE